MSTSTEEPRDLRDALGAYALGAVDEDERAEIERWLATDTDARADADELARAARKLDSPEGPSATVWTAIEAAIESGEHRAPSVVQLTAVRQARGFSRRVSRVVAGAAAVAAAAAIAVVASTGSESKPPNTRESAVAQAASAALSADGAERISLVTWNGTDSVSAVVLPDGRGYVLDAVLADTDGAVYRLQAITAQGPVILAVLDPDAAATAFRLPFGALGMIVTQGDEVLASGAVPNGLLSPEPVPPTDPPPPPTSPPDPGLNLPTLPPLLPTLPGGGLDLGALTSLLIL